MTGQHLPVDGDLQAYARRLVDLHAVQREAGELLTAWHEGAGPMAMTLAHQLGAQAAQIRGELARWTARNLPAASPMPAASHTSREARGCEHDACEGAYSCVYADEALERHLTEVRS